MEQAHPHFPPGAHQLAGWSFTGPPPGLQMRHQPLQFYQTYPPMGMPYPPQMNMPMHPPRPNMPPTHPPPPRWMGNMAQPFPMNPAPLAVTPGHLQIEKKYANKKEREKAKRERKEARKLAENPLQPLTEDVQPRQFLNDGERQETLQWIEERKARFPTRERIANEAAQADTLNQAGGSGGQSACDSRLFAVLQEQHRRGLLRSAGTEDLYRSIGAQGSGRGTGAKRGRGRGRGRGQGHDSGPLPGRGGTAADVAPDAAPVSDLQQAVDPPTSQKEIEAAEAQAAVIAATQQQDDSVDAGHAVGASETAKADMHQPVAAHGHASLDNVGAETSSGQGIITREEQALETAHGESTAKRKLDDVSAPGGQTGERKASRSQRGWQRAGPQDTAGASKPCLLHRLLAADVRQDRSLLLQVFRFFVANDFLQTVDDTPLQYPESARG